MSKDFIHNNILQGVADAIRYCDDTTAGIAPVDYAERIRAIDKLIPQPDALNFYMPNGGTISINKVGNPYVVELEYWLDENRQWLIWQPDANGNRSLTLTAGQRMYVRNTSETQTGFSTGSNNYYNFAFTSTVEAHGNTNSLLCKNAGVVTVLTTSCYFAMFYKCASLVTAPELPATTLANSCYRSMFYGCTSLVTAPELPATTLVEYCYGNMFYGCTSLVAAPELPATTLAEYCYVNMFYGCTSLVAAPELPATTLAKNCYRVMFYNCTSLTTAPELPAITLASGCYFSMFEGCTHLRVIRTMMTDISATACISYWVVNVAAQGDFYCPAELTITTGISGIPSDWTRHDI